MGAPKPEALEVLRAELEIFEESIWRSEETGEKRFNFFVSLLTAVAAGLIALWSAEKLTPEVQDNRKYISIISCVVLLIFGLVTYLRMRHRDQVTAQYKRCTWFIRSLYRKAIPDLRELDLPRPKVPPEPPGSEKKKEKKNEKSRWHRFSRGGYTVSLGVLNGCLLAVIFLFAASWEGIRMAVPVGAGVLLATALCWYGAEYFPPDECVAPEWPRD